MASISKISDKATKVNFSSNVLYYFAFGTIVLSGDVMQIKFINGLEQRFNFSDFTTTETTFENYIDSLIALDYFRVPTTGSETSTNAKLDLLIANNATSLNQYSSENTLDKILKELKIHTKLLRKILN